MHTITKSLTTLLFLSSFSLAANPDLRLLSHAFDHLGTLGEQSPAAAAIGVNLLYTTSIGSLAYSGLPPEKDLTAALDHARLYATHSKSAGIQYTIAYVCATSIVNLPTFNQNWSPELQHSLSTPPSQWLQQDPTGKPLPSWYGPPYNPACMNNPDWRTYEKFIIRLQLSANQDGIFFDNPTVHPQGCYCPFCMQKFAAYIKLPATTDLAALRKTAQDRPEDFKRFRATIAADFLADMRTYARTINPHAFVTANNSLNSPDVFYSQIRDYGYNIDAMSQSQDWITLEDMASQPRTLPSGQTLEYSPLYHLVHAISHDKPIAAITLADADYTTPPHLTQLAMLEAAANHASYLSWPTWPDNIRPKMIASLKPTADFIAAHRTLFADSIPRSDITLYLPYQTWPTTPTCPELATAQYLSAHNIQYTVTTDPSVPHLNPADPSWQKSLPSSIELTPPSTLRALISDTPTTTLVFLLNLNIQKLSNLEDKVTPTQETQLKLRLPGTPTQVHLLTPTSTQSLPFQFTTASPYITLTLPPLEVGAVLQIDIKPN